jgi:hypothetical protein
MPCATISQISSMQSLSVRAPRRRLRVWPFSRPGGSSRSRDSCRRRQGCRSDRARTLRVRAANLIGQLGDPHYLRKANALYYDFEGTGLNRQLGYGSPADLVDKYPQFYWNSVSSHIQPAIRYLNVTSSGRQWIAGLYSNVFRAEREVGLSGPQP